MAAERRMLSKKITNSARFLRMPTSSRELYFHLCQNADDDGVVEAYAILKMIGATEDDLKVLVAKNFIIILNEDLVTYITDWKEHNKIRADRKIDSIYKDLLVQIVPDIQLLEKKPRADTKKITGQPLDVQWTDTGQTMDNPTPTTIKKVDGIGEDRIGEDRIGKESYSMDGADGSPIPEAICNEKTPPNNVISLLLNDKSTYHVTDVQVAELQELYPAADVMQELRNMKGWIIANPQKRKTRKGVLRFINGWLAREQDRGGSKLANDVGCKQRTYECSEEDSL